MLDVYANGNLKSLFEALDEKEEIIVEEPTNDEFKAELKKAIDKSLGKDKAKVADPAIQAVEVQKEEVELEERQLSASEKAEKEKNVKGMKKNLQGFKDRYGDRAKEVMYATATKQAKGE
jgi:regulator of protease activity HflC (stomatin/prohibitin superfamily)